MYFAFTFWFSLVRFEIRRRNVICSGVIHVSNHSTCTLNNLNLKSRKCNAQGILLLLWRYNPVRVLTFSTISFHLRRSCTCSAHFISFILFRSFLTSYSHRDLGLPADLPVNSFHLGILFTQHCHYVPSAHINRVLSYPFNSRMFSSYYQPFIPLSRIFSMSNFPRRVCWPCAQPPLPWRN